MIYYGGSFSIKEYYNLHLDTLTYWKLYRSKLSPNKINVIFQTMQIFFDILYFFYSFFIHLKKALHPTG